MSIDYNASLAMGFRVEPEALEKAFGKRVPETSHLEDRWDQKTGKRLPPVKVVDQVAGEAYELDGKVYEYLDELAEELAEQAGGVVDTLTNYSSPPDGFIFGVRLPANTEDEFDDGKLSVGGSTSWAQAQRAAKGLAKLKARLTKLGLKGLKEPRLFVAWSVS